MSKKNNKKNAAVETTTVDSKEMIKIECTVQDHCRGDFRCVTPAGTIINAKPAGSMRTNEITILPGDTVIVEVSQYDMSRGRITYRNTAKR